MDIRTLPGDERMSAAERRVSLGAFRGLLDAGKIIWTREVGQEPVEAKDLTEGDFVTYLSDVFSSLSQAVWVVSKYLADVAPLIFRDEQTIKGILDSYPDLTGEQTRAIVGDRDDLFRHHVLQPSNALCGVDKGMKFSAWDRFIKSLQVLKEMAEERHEQGDYLCRVLNLRLSI